MLIDEIFILYFQIFYLQSINQEFKFDLKIIAKHQIKFSWLILNRYIGTY